MLWCQMQQGDTYKKDKLEIITNQNALNSGIELFLVDDVYQLDGKNI